jgi:hypothetical protein
MWAQVRVELKEAFTAEDADDKSITAEGAEDAEEQQDLGFSYWRYGLSRQTTKPLHSSAILSALCG